MTGTSIRISDDTYKIVIKTRGILEQMFLQKLSLDDAVYLSARLISFIYETVQRLVAQNRIKIVEVSEGRIRFEGIENVADVLPSIINEITEIKEKLAEKDASTIAKSEHKSKNGV